MEIVIKDVTGKNHTIQVEGEHHIEEVLGVVRDAKNYVTFQHEGSNGTYEVAVAKEHIVSIITKPDTHEASEKRKGRQLNF